jgi:DNA-binding PadR family transcriptional regulator
VFLERKLLKEMQTRMIKNFLDIIILAKLRDESALSGYDAVNLIHKKFGILISSGSIYSLLLHMERKGLIKGSWSQRKRIYTLTDKGIRTIDSIKKSKEEIQGFIRILISA